MKTVIYPGSFNPWHKGHEDILNKALEIFDRVILARSINKQKNIQAFYNLELTHSKITCISFKGLLVDYIKEHFEIRAVIRGLRNGHDLQYEMNMQYNNEDLGLNIPVVYFVTDRKYGHISSSSIREIQEFKK